jgi:hypothetical protein
VARGTGRGRVAWRQFPRRFSSRSRDALASRVMLPVLSPGLRLRWP